MPYAAAEFDALAAVADEDVLGFGVGVIRSDDDQEGLAAQRHEVLRAERVAFQAVQFVRGLAGGGAEDAER